MLLDANHEGFAISPFACRMSDLSLYWDLADASASKRLGAALKLVIALKEAENKTDLLTEDSKERVLIKIKNPIHQYALNRLVC